jgi:hypothetical protein
MNTQAEQRVFFTISKKKKRSPLCMSVMTEQDIIEAAQKRLKKHGLSLTVVEENNDYMHEGMCAEFGLDPKKNALLAYNLAVLMMPLTARERKSAHFYFFAFSLNAAGFKAFRQDVNILLDEMEHLEKQIWRGLAGQANPRVFLTLSHGKKSSPFRANVMSAEDIQKASAKRLLKHGVSVDELKPWIDERFDSICKDLCLDPAKDIALASAFAILMMPLSKEEEGDSGRFFAAFLANATGGKEFRDAVLSMVDQIKYLGKRLQAGDAVQTSSMTIAA